MSAPTSMNPQQFADLVLADLGLAPSANREADLLGWMQLEEPASKWWGGFGTPAAPTRINPLNTSRGSIGVPATGYVTSSGLGSFADLTAAAQGTADTIAQKNMGGIHASLAADAPPSSFFGALQGAPWAGSHYAGAHFPTGPIAEWSAPAVTGKLGTGGNLAPFGGQSAAVDPSTAGPSTDDMVFHPFAGVPILGHFKPAKSTILRGGLLFLGLIVLIIALHAMANSNAGDGPLTVVLTGSSTAADNAKRRVGQGGRHVIDATTRAAAAE